MNRLFRVSLLVLTILFSGTAMAHPGHGTFGGHEIWHYVSSPIHIGIVLGVTVILIAGYKVFKRTRSSSKG
jgi:hypothetical protein